MSPESSLSIGELAERAGVARSALRFYEAQGLIQAERTEGGQRRYRREVLRRVAFIRAAQRVGLHLHEVAEALADLPSGRTPTVDDWAGLSAKWQERLDERIRLLQELRDDLSTCIGCGCLSLKTCALSNPGDRAKASGPGPHYHLVATPAAPSPAADDGD